jgi:glycine C-acetyltransferase
MLFKLTQRRGFSTLKDVCNNAIKQMKEAGTFKNERVISTQQQMQITANNKNVLNFCANNYLGLANNPAVMQAAKDGLDSHGFGMASVRFICGTQDQHKHLESQISDWHKQEDTILFPSCFDANAGFFEAILTSEDAVISDQLNHASIIDGIRLCKAKRHRYTHMDMDELEKIL